MFRIRCETMKFQKMVFKLVSRIKKSIKFKSIASLFLKNVGYGKLEIPTSDVFYAKVSLRTPASKIL